MQRARERIAATRPTGLVDDYVNAHETPPPQTCQSPVYWTANVAGMAYYWIEQALTDLSPRVRAEVARDLHGFIVELTEHPDAA
jgi:hypothetical protein